jgi:hypothetical protein
MHATPILCLALLTACVHAGDTTAESSFVERAREADEAARLQFVAGANSCLATLGDRIDKLGAETRTVEPTFYKEQLRDLERERRDLVMRVDGSKWLDLADWGAAKPGLQKSLDALDQRVHAVRDELASQIVDRKRVDWPDAHVRLPCRGEVAFCCAPASGAPARTGG